MLSQDPVDLGNAQALRRIALQSLEATGRPQLAAFGVEILAIEIGHAPLWACSGAVASGDARDAVKREARPHAA